jgi:type IV secretion system protein VirD4
MFADARPEKDVQGLITEAGNMVVYCAGFAAIYGRQPLYFQDETFAAPATIPQPKRSDSLSNLPAPEVQIL